MRFQFSLSLNGYLQSKIRDDTGLRLFQPVHINDAPNHTLGCHLKIANV